MVTLYKKTKTGGIQECMIYASGPRVITIYGIVGGKMQRSEILCNPKNIGKSNETSAEEQAVLEAASKIQKKKDEGYFQTIEEAETTEVFLPMLASPYDKRKGKLSTPFTVQPKLDGVRALIYFENNQWNIMSRGGKSYKVSHIIEEIEELGNRDYVYDGELYIHGLPLQDIVSLVKDPRFESKDLEFWLYDCFKRDKPEVKWISRASYLYHFDYHTGGHIVPTPSEIAKDEESLEKIHKRFISSGYEGVIIREYEGSYEIGKRSRHLIKFKKFQDGEFQIVDYTEGLGKFVGCVIWTCVTVEGKRFNVVPKGSIEQKKKWFNTAEKYIGKRLTVQFQDWTKDKVPQFPVGITIRDYE